MHDATLAMTNLFRRNGGKLCGAYYKAQVESKIINERQKIQNFKFLKLMSLILKGCISN